MNYADDFDSLMEWLSLWCMEMHEDLVLWDGAVPVPATHREYRRALKENPASFDYKREQVDGWIGSYAFIVHGFDVPEFLSKYGVRPAPAIVAQLNDPGHRKLLFSQYEDFRARPEVQGRADTAFLSLLTLRNELLQEAGLGLQEDASPALAAVKAITITPTELISRITEGLSPYIPNVDHRTAFGRLLQGEDVVVPVLFKAQVNQIVDIFHRLKERNHITESKASVKSWVCRNLAYLNTAGEVADFSPDTVKDVLSGKSRVSRSSRLPGFEWLPLVPEKKE